tara:strand:- start:89 stop:1000 length:912 start_codon:yes stop_codon:yes gene_type:complete
MSDFQVLLIAGTHGNEINAPWLFEHSNVEHELLKIYGLKALTVIGNPQARKLCKRYLDRDLNRSFKKQLLASEINQDYEVKRAKELISEFGADSLNPCQLAFDLHTTTASMGSSLVLYGRRPADLALASLIQAKIGIPIYLHEGDDSQQGFLVESWPSGLVIEIGPAPQGLLQMSIVKKTKFVLEAAFESLAKIKNSTCNYPDKLIIHSHQGSLDFPRDLNGHINALVHPLLEGEDWKPLTSGKPLFEGFDKQLFLYNGEDGCIPVFINEAAYMEKNIAMSLTKRETLKVKKEWKDQLFNLLS